MEGFEKSVLEGMDFHKFRPWIFVIEATLPGTDVPSYREWEDILLTNDYEMSLDHGCNRYYFDKLLPAGRLEKIKSGFGKIWNRADEYKIEAKKEKISRLSMLKYLIRNKGIMTAVKSLKFILR